MVNTSLNFSKINFPVIFHKDLNDCDNLDNLGTVKSKIKVNLKIDKISEVLFLAQGGISTTIESECQKCCNPLEVELKVQTKIRIRELEDQLIDEKKRYETHYQELDNFNILELISEELQLNFPSIIVCSSCKNLDKNNKYKDQKIRPFKKIRDLIK